MSTAVRRARREKSKGRVRQIRKIHVGAVVAASGDSACGGTEANHFSVAVTGLNETQLQRCMARVSRWCS